MFSHLVDSGITGEQLELCWFTTLASTWPTRAQIDGWKSCWTMRTLTSWSCWLGTRETWRTSGRCPQWRPKTLQVCYMMRILWKVFCENKMCLKLTCDNTAPWKRQCLFIVIFDFLPPWNNPEKRGLMYMETSALDSTNVEHAFNEVLTGVFSLSVYSTSSLNDLLMQTCSLPFLFSSHP